MGTQKRSDFSLETHEIILFYRSGIIGRNPVSKHQIQHEYGDEQADAERDCRTRLPVPNSQAGTRTGEY